MRIPLRFIITVAAAVLAHSAAAELECRWADVPPVIDGRLEEPVWQRAHAVEDFQIAWLPEPARKPPTHTRARLLWDREYLYFAAEMEDTDLFANVTERDAAIWTCDVFEVFLKPAKDRTGYYELEVNAANGQLDMFLPSRGSGGYARHAREREFHLESKVQLQGTLNNWSDQDRGWTVEARIPWRDFLPTGGRPAPGEVWLHALCRYDYSTGLETAALSSTAPLRKPDFHHYEDYVPLKFVGPHEAATVPLPQWKTSRLAGSPEPPLPFRTVPAYPQLKINQPVTIAVEPGRDSFLLLENNGYLPVRRGRLCRVASDPKIGDPETLLELEESLYDVCFHPRHAENGYLYLGANGRMGEGPMDFNNRVLRYTMDRATGRLDPASRIVLMEWHSHGHNGMALRFGHDGMLYITSGDGTSDSDEWDSGQDLTRPLAKLLRIDVDRPGEGRLYGIPADNPFLQTPGARPETWAYGFRNPWRMAIDRETGELWVGENGQDLWEYARIVRRGENYGWPIFEGSHDFHLHRRRGPTPITKPLIEHSHTEFRSLTGGIVYRGEKFPALHGCYIYGDHSTGQIWAARQRDGKLIKNDCIADTALGITGFCETPQGDILVVDYLGNAIHRVEPAGTTASAVPFPTRLSETGLFTDTARLQPDAALLTYEVNAAAWHDGASSERFIALPGAERMELMESGGWNFPDGATVVQTLTVEGRRLESRILLRQQGEWAPYTYAWNAAQTDAELVGTAGRMEEGWRIPSRQECAFCHSRAANFVLGLSTVQLNRAGADGENQIAKWERTGRLKYDHSKREESEWRGELGKERLKDVPLQARLDLVLPAAGQRPPARDSALLPVAAAKLPRLADPFNAQAPLEERARAYLHANCSHCHVRNGGGNSTMQLASHFTTGAMEVVDATPLHGNLGVPEARLVAPGAPGNSLLVFRPAIRGPGQMPPVGTLAPDPQGVALLAQWILAMRAEARPTEPAE
jgi:glucose/arabinose dehydrogenase/mono/diheme cytochrome c family protein